MDQRIDTAIKIIHHESARNVPVRELATRVNLSVWHFTRLFKAEMSISPKRYMRDFKIKRATELLTSSFLSVKEVSANVGSGDRSHFSRTFKRLCGYAPSSAKNRRGTTSP